MAEFSHTLLLPRNVMIRTMNANDGKRKNDIPDEPVVFVPGTFIRDFEQIMEKLTVSHREFSRVAEELKPFDTKVM
jgi:hypothetical protein